MYFSSSHDAHPNIGVQVALSLNGNLEATAYKQNAPQMVARWGWITGAQRVHLHEEVQ